MDHAKRRTTWTSVGTALRLASHGFKVFPLAPEEFNPIDGYGSHFSNAAEATKNKDQIRKWWHKCPDAVPAIQTGPESGILAVQLWDEDGIVEFRRQSEMFFNLGTPHLTLRWFDGMPVQIFLYRWPDSVSMSELKEKWDEKWGDLLVLENDGGIPFPTYIHIPAPRELNLLASIPELPIWLARELTKFPF